MWRGTTPSRFRLPLRWSMRRWKPCNPTCSRVGGRCPWGRGASRLPAARAWGLRTYGACSPSHVIQASGHFARSWLVTCGFALPCRGAHWARSRQSWRWWRRLVMARSHHVVLPHAARHHPYPGLWNRGNRGCSDELILKELIPRDDRPRVEPPNGGDAGSFLSYLAW